mmetsp:Transcript_9969/g.45123  ORF Transcript_9969/g.45123 Transcript_9969/m.45123 type:complete len:210 (-) Transcript_9969:811-1440(-)
MPNSDADAAAEVASILLGAGPRSSSCAGAARESPGDKPGLLLRRARPTRDRDGGEGDVTVRVLVPLAPSPTAPSSPPSPFCPFRPYAAPSPPSPRCPPRRCPRDPLWGRPCAGDDLPLPARLLAALSGFGSSSARCSARLAGPDDDTVAAAPSVATPSSHSCDRSSLAVGRCAGSLRKQAVRKPRSSGDIPGGSGGDSSRTMAKSAGIG